MEEESHRGKLTPETAALLVECERNGLSREDMCNLAGVSTAALRSWLHSGRHATIPNKYQAFAQEFDAARSELTRSLMQTIVTAGTTGVEQIKVERYPNGKEKTTITREPSPEWAAKVLRYKDPVKYAELIGTHRAGNINVNGPSQIVVEYVGAATEGKNEIEVKGEEEVDDIQTPPGMLPS